MFTRKDIKENKPTQSLTSPNHIRGFNIDKDWLKNAKQNRNEIYIKNNSASEIHFIHSLKIRNQYGVTHLSIAQIYLLHFAN